MPEAPTRNSHTQYCRTGFDSDRNISVFFSSSRDHNDKQSNDGDPLNEKTTLMVLTIQAMVRAALSNPVLQYVTC